MNSETPGGAIRRARHEARLTQVQLAAELGVHKNTVADWEKGKYFPDRHWGALNKLLRINLRPPGPSEPEPEPVPELDDDPETLEALRRAYRDEPEKVRQVARKLLENEAAASGRRDEDRSRAGLYGRRQAERPPVAGQHGHA